MFQTPQRKKTLQLDYLLMRYFINFHGLFVRTNSSEFSRLLWGRHLPHNKIKPNRKIKKRTKQTIFYNKLECWVQSKANLLKLIYFLSFFLVRLKPHWCCHLPAGSWTICVHLPLPFWFVSPLKGCTNILPPFSNRAAHHFRSKAQV